MQNSLSIKTVFSGLIILLMVFCFLVFTGCDSDEMKAAKEGMNGEISRIEGQIDSLQTEIENAEALVATEETPLDENVIPALESAISEAKTVNFEAPSVSGSLEEVTAKTEDLKGVDYTTNIKALQDAEKAVNDSIEQMKLVTNPTEAFVIERLQAVEDIGDISAVTEDNDPNGQLGKDGGYTATVYFTSPLIDQSLVYGDSVIEKGTDAGGAVEVYSTVEDANKRNDYLASFDGGILSSGSHTVVGTVLVRTSDELTASQQDQLEAAIIESLTRLG